MKQELGGWYQAHGEELIHKGMSLVLFKIEQLVVRRNRFRGAEWDH